MLVCQVASQNPEKQSHPEHAGQADPGACRFSQSCWQAQRDGRHDDGQERHYGSVGMCNPARRGVHRRRVMTNLDSNTRTHCLSSQSDPHCLFSRLILALLPSAGGNFHKTGVGVLSACPHHSKQRGRGCSAYYTSLLPLLSLYESMLPSLFAPLSLTTFNFIHSLIPPLPHLPLSIRHT